MDALDLESCWEKMYVTTYKTRGQGTSIAISGVDIALHDLAGKALGVPGVPPAGGPVPGAGAGLRQLHEPRPLPRGLRRARRRGDGGRLLRREDQDRGALLLRRQGPGRGRGAGARRARGDRAQGGAAGGRQLRLQRAHRDQGRADAGALRRLPLRGAHPLHRPARHGPDRRGPRHPGGSRGSSSTPATTSRTSWCTRRWTSCSRT